MADVAALLGQAGDWAARSQGLAQLREFAETHESPELVADAVGILIPHLAEMLKELRSALLGDCCDTIAVLVQRCAPPRPGPAATTTFYLLETCACSRCMPCAVRTSSAPSSLVQCFGCE